MGTARVFFDGEWKHILNAYTWRDGWVQVKALRVMGDTGWVQIQFENSTMIAPIDDWRDMLAMAA
jgi:hypothetical protein